VKVGNYRTKVLKQ